MMLSCVAKAFKFPPPIKHGLASLSCACLRLQAMHTYLVEFRLRRSRRGRDESGSKRQPLCPILQQHLSSLPQFYSSRPLIHTLNKAQLCAHGLQTAGRQFALADDKDSCSTYAGERSYLEAVIHLIHSGSDQEGLGSASLIPMWPGGFLHAMKLAHP